MTVTTITTDAREVDAQQQRDFNEGWGHGFDGRPMAAPAHLAPHYAAGYRSGRIAVCPALA